MAKVKKKPVKLVRESVKVEAAEERAEQAAKKKKKK